MPVALKLILFAGGLYALLVFGAWLIQRQLMYHPDTVRTSPRVFGLTNVDEIIFETPDGARILSWWSRAKSSLPTLLYFHGNAGTLATRGERIRQYQAQGFGIFMMTYRGYGGSTGRPSERANVRDAKQAYDYLIKNGVTPDSIVLYGESLGSGVAVQVAAAKDVAGVILDAPYTSMVDVAAVHYPYLPARWFLIDRYQTVKFIRRVNAPLLIVHGEDDAIIPVAMGQQLFDIADEPKAIATFPGAGHADHYMFGSYAKIFDWLRRLPRTRAVRAAE